MIFSKSRQPQEIYERLIQPITWETDSKEASYVERIHKRQPDSIMATQKESLHLMPAKL